MKGVFNLYTKPTAYETNLIEKAKLLNLQKTDVDLFFILQTNTITYHQLMMTGIHGTTEAGGRLSLKRLEKNGYIRGRTIQTLNGTKYFTLTSRGKERLKKLFPNSFLEHFQVDFEKRPPTGLQQLPHRIMSNDFYFAYISCPYATPFLWKLEKGFLPAHNSIRDQLPRCDAYLDTGYNKYFIEQDNYTQSESVLSNKLKRYLDSDIFSEDAIKNTQLVFTVSTELKARPYLKPSYSIYRVLSKATKLWSALEKELQTELDITGFLNQINTRSVLEVMLTPSEKSLFHNLVRRYEHIRTLTDAKALKRHYLHDTTYKEERNKEMDTLFRKRLHMKFGRAIENIPVINARLRKGMHLYVVPNHRIRDHLPYIMPKEYRLSETFLQVLYYMGLNIESWNFRHSYYVRESSNKIYFFSNVFLNVSKSFIIMEDIVHDLGGYERIRYFITTHHVQHPILFILLVENHDDAALFCRTFSNALQREENRSIVVCFLNKDKSLFSNTPNTAYIIKDIETCTTSHIIIDYEEYTREFILIERQE